MAKKLSIDLDMLDSTINDYTTAIDDLKTAVSAVDKAMTDLRGTRWQSDASVAYFSQYSEDWKQSVNAHLTALEQMKGSLVYAQREYLQLYYQIEALRSALNI